MAASGELLVGEDFAMKHVRIASWDDDASTYLFMAQGIVIDRLERATTDSEVLARIAAWDEDSVPGAIKAAIVAQFAELYRFRGDDEFEIPTSEHGRLSNRVERFLGPWLERPLA